MLRGLRRGPGGRRGRMMFDRALMLLDNGQFDEAAAELDGLAQMAEARGVLPARLALVLLQAGRAHLGAGRPAEALARGRRALELLAAAGRPWRAAQVARRMIAEFRTRGYTREADALQQEVEARLGSAPPAAPGFAPAAARALPERCAGCGAPLRPDEVEWIDPQTAECPYCGTPARAR